MASLTEKEVRTLLKRVTELEEKNYSEREICKILRCSKKTIHKYRENGYLGLKRRIQRDKAIKMLNRGLSPSEISKILDCTRAIIYKIKKDEKIVLEKLKGSNKSS